MQRNIKSSNLHTGMQITDACFSTAAPSHYGIDLPNAALRMALGFFIGNTEHDFINKFF
jgi:hypothetical protein